MHAAAAAASGLIAGDGRRGSRNLAAVARIGAAAMAAEDAVVCWRANFLLEGGDGLDGRCGRRRRWRIREKPERTSERSRYKGRGLLCKV